MTHTATNLRRGHGPDAPRPEAWADCQIGPPEADPVQVRVYGSLTPGALALLWVHGGSWIRGSVEQWNPALMSLASRIRGVVIGVRYRLAPEAHHPAPVLDVIAAVNAVRHVIGPEAPLVLGGDSAGGTLAASASLQRPDQINGQVLAYPPFDPQCATASFDDHAGEFPSRHQLVHAWAAYAGHPPQTSPVPLTPLAYSNLSASPPVSMMVGLLDPVRGDVMRYATRLRIDGVSVRLHQSELIRHGDFLRPPVEGQQPVHDWIAAETNHYFNQGAQ